ncbi:hypothetical protein QBC43DRAFT_117795 [Cladorrhinum sp. PSN259]|nr:hypothetical protein QBC43DRAFT_117795 [Cladorrhinum sp. PSN259]
MCYFEQTRWNCGYWKWGNFRQQCHKEYRTGETCGLKLVFQTALLATPCKLCDQRFKKERRIHKMSMDIDRWTREGNRRATIEKTWQDISEIQAQVDDLWRQHEQRVKSL